MIIVAFNKNIVIAFVGFDFFFVILLELVNYFHNPKLLFSGSFLYPKQVHIFWNLTLHLVFQQV